MKFGRGVVWATLVVLVLAAGPALAGEYRPEMDKTISIQVPQGTVVVDKLAAVGELMAEVQQRVLENFDHDYYFIWLEINGTRVMAIDPPAMMFADPPDQK